MTQEREGFNSLHPEVAKHHKSIHMAIWDPKRKPKDIVTTSTSPLTPQEQDMILTERGLLDTSHPSGHVFYGYIAGQKHIIILPELRKLEEITRRDLVNGLSVRLDFSEYVKANIQLRRKKVEELKGYLSRWYHEEQKSLQIDTLF